MLFGVELTPVGVLTYFAAAAVIAFIAALMFLPGRIPVELRGVVPEYQVGNWLRDSFVLFGFAALVTLNARFAILLLGVTHTDEMTGVYALANTLATLLSFVVVAVNRSLAPRIAAFLAQDRLAEVQEAVLTMTRFSFLAALVPGAAFIFYGKQILAIFGPEFPDGALTLAILAVGQLIAIGSGNAGMTLLMSGNERIATRGMAIGSVVNVVLCVGLIPHYGILGAAIAVATGILCSNAILVTAAYRRLGIATTFMGGAIHGKKTRAAE